VGAIDGTHVPANVSVEIQEKFRGRKEGTIKEIRKGVDLSRKTRYNP